MMTRVGPRWNEEYHRRWRSCHCDIFSSDCIATQAHWALPDQPCQIHHFGHKSTFDNQSRQLGTTWCCNFPLDFPWSSPWFISVWPVSLLPQQRHLSSDWGYFIDWPPRLFCLSEIKLTFFYPLLSGALDFIHQAYYRHIDINQSYLEVEDVEHWSQDLHHRELGCSQYQTLLCSAH